MLAFIRSPFILVSVVLCLIALQATAHPSERAPGPLIRSPTRAYRYKQATREHIISRSNRPAAVQAARRAEASVIPVVLPESTCAYTSTGSTPWAVYNGLDIDGDSRSQQIGSVATRDACQDLCASKEGCIATTYAEAYQSCYIVYDIVRYKAATPYLITVRGASCGDNAGNVPTDYLSQSTCCMEYRES